MEWTKPIAQLAEGEVGAIDGKTVRRSHDRNSGKQAIHLVSAWASANRVTLGQVKTEEKSNEITAIPRLLQLLDLHDASSPLTPWLPEEHRPRDCGRRRRLCAGGKGEPGPIA